MLSEEEQAAREALWRKASGVFDTSLIWKPAPSWNGIRDAHKIASIRSEFISAAIVGKRDRMSYLAEHYWPADQQESALTMLTRLYRSARGESG
jgi:hypothetical protein